MKKNNIEFFGIKNVFKIQEIVHYICKFMKISTMFCFMQVNQDIYYTIIENKIFRTIKNYKIRTITDCFGKFSNNDQQIIEYIIRNYDFPKGKLGKKIRRYCELGYINIVKTIFRNINVNLHDDYIFKQACIYGHFDIVEWILEVVPDMSVQCIEFAFQSYCIRGNINMAKKMLKKYGFDIHKNNEYIFRECCYFGKIDVLKWIIETDPKTNIRAENDEAFRECCRSGHVNIAKWLIELDPTIDIHVNDDEAFRLACYNGHYDIAYWMVHKFPNINVNSKYDYAFRWACRNGHLNIAEWLYNDYSIDINAKSCYAFRYSCTNRHRDVAVWLTEIHSSYEIKEEDGKIIGYYGEYLIVC